MRARAVVRCLGGLAGLVWATGCAHYQWGVTAHVPFATLYVEPVRNHTLLPQAQEPIATELRSQLIKDGRVQVVDSPQGADAILQVVITDYHRDVAATREQDTGLASKFTETLTTGCTLIDTRTGRSYFTNRTVTTRRDVFTDNGNPHSSLVGDQLQAEYNTVPLLAESLSDAIVQTVQDVW